MSTATQIAAREAAAEVRKAGGSALAFIAGYRRLARCPGLSRKDALEVAVEAFSTSYRAFCEAQERGETLPPLDPPKVNFEARRTAALARGGII